MWSCIEKRELRWKGEGAKGKTQRQSAVGERERRLERERPRPACLGWKREVWSVQDLSLKWTFATVYLLGPWADEGTACVYPATDRAGQHNA